MLIYLPAVFFDFTFDDNEIVANNPRIARLDRPAGYLATSWWNKPDAIREYRPAAMASFALNHALLGPQSWGFHAVNVALHGLNCALAALLAGLFVRNRKAILAAGLIFAIHPVHVEAVVGIVGRAELMVTAGFLGALLAAEASRRAAGWPKRVGWVLAVFPAAALAVFSKEHGVMLLAAIPLLAFAGRTGEAGRKGGTPRRANGRNMPAFLPATLAAALAVGLYFLARRAVLGSFLPPSGAGSVAPLDNPLVLLNASARLLTALSIVGRYGLLLLAPFHPSPDYSMRVIAPVESVGDPLWIPGATLLVAGIAGLWLLRRRAGVWVGLMLLLVTFLVASNLFVLIGTIMGERLLYLPSAGFSLLAGSLLFGETEDPIESSTAARRRRARTWILGAWLAALLVQHFLYLPKWRNNEALFGYMIRRTPESGRAHLAYATVLERDGRVREALEQNLRGLRIFPQSIDGQVNLGRYYGLLSEFDRALPPLESAHQANPWNERITKELAWALTRAGKPGEAEALLRGSIRTSSTPLLAEYFLAQWLLGQQRGAEAVPIFERCLKVAVPEERPEIEQQLQAARELGGAPRTKP